MMKRRRKKSDSIRYGRRRIRQNTEGGNMLTQNSEWIYCLVCENKTRNRIREDRILVNFPLYCPKCKQETLTEVRNLEITVIKEPDAMKQSR